MRKVLLFFALVFVCTATLRAQNTSNIDSLRSALTVASDIEKIEIYEELAWEYRKSKPDSTIILSRNAIELTDRLKLNRSKAKAINFLGVAHHYKGDNVAAFDYYNQALEEGIEMGDSVQHGHSLNSLARLFLVQGDLIKSYNYYLRSIEIFEKIGNKGGLSYCFKSLSELYQTQNKLDKALEMTKKSLQIREELGSVPGQVSVLVEMATIYERMEKFDLAYDHYIDALAKAEYINDEINIARIDLGIAHLYHLQNRSSKALEVARKALAIASKTSNSNLTNQIRLELGKILFERKMYTEARDQLLRIVKNPELTKQLFEEKEAYYYLSEIEKDVGDIKKAYDYYVSHNELKESLENAENARQIERFESRLEIDNKNKENEILRLNNSANKAEIEQQRAINLALAIIAIIIAALLATIWYANWKAKKANEELQYKNEHIEEQKTELEAQADQIERQNKNLQKRNETLLGLNDEKDTLMNIVAHDLKSPLNRIKGIVELCKFTELTAEQQKYVDLMDETSKSGIEVINDILDLNQFTEKGQQIQKKSVDLGSLLLEKAGSFLALARSKQIEIDLKGSNSSIFSETDETYLSRIFDNLISNALKFSDSGSMVTLSLREDSGYAIIKIKDQGQGFSEEDKKLMYGKFNRLSARPTGGETTHGLGLAIVKTLIEQIGATISLDSTQGKGSEFTIKILAKAKGKPKSNEKTLTQTA